ncbi:hypothetical protein GCM10018785_61100 [Streptomyces longispororuber]|uniref:Uncharacterized protein n=1 Tax=Streptomyces longispororuber TaxID=68230 RepID=A0A919A3V1_9ACTN|nr:hypothetical protein GCM10018785_61100 [Streptomyces longispororuber]
MGSEEGRFASRSQDGHTCPSCGRPVATAVKRRKVLGAYVPVWGPAPCHNPACDARATEEPEEVRVRRARRSRRRGAHQKGRPPTAGPAPADTKSVTDVQPDPGA